MARKFSVVILERTYTVMDSPEPLRDSDDVRCMALADHEQCIIWIDPKVKKAERERIIAHAISLAWRARLHEAPLVD